MRVYINHRIGIAPGLTIGTIIYMITAWYMGQSGDDKNGHDLLHPVIEYVIFIPTNPSSFLITILLLLLALCLRIKFRSSKIMERVISKYYSNNAATSPFKGIAKSAFRTYFVAEGFIYSRVASSVYSISIFMFFINLYYELVYGEFHTGLLLNGAFVCTCLVAFLHLAIYMINKFSEDGSLRAIRSELFIILAFSLVAVSIYSLFYFFDK